MNRLLYSSQQAAERFFSWLGSSLRMVYPTLLIFYVIVLVFELGTFLGYSRELNQYFNTATVMAVVITVALYFGILSMLVFCYRTFNWRESLPWMENMTDARGGLVWYDLFIFLVVALITFLRWWLFHLLWLDMILLGLATALTPLAAMTRAPRTHMVRVIETMDPAGNSTFRPEDIETIADSYHLSREQLAAANPNLVLDELVPGDEVTLP
jgi:hypothetical protein